MSIVKDHPKRTLSNVFLIHISPREASLRYHLSARQGRNYKKTMYRTHEPVLVIIGVGGTIKEPEHLYCLDLNRLNFTTLFYGT